MALRRIDAERRRYLPLLLLGDDQESLIDGYLDRCDLYAWEEDGEVRAICAAERTAPDVVEIRNLAVSPERRRRGLGRRLLLAVCGQYPGRAAVLGPGEVPGTLAFYRACGFAPAGRVENYFPAHYDHPIMEEGVTLRDQIILRREAERPYGK